MKTFKIRDLMIALRPGIGTPQRPKPFDCCLPTCIDISDDCGDSIQPFDDSGGCGDTCDCTVDVSNCECSDDGSICDCSNDFTCGCTQTCGCTLTCGPCSGGCTGTCEGTCHACTVQCTKACTRAITVVCGIAHSVCAHLSCGVSLKQPIENMAPQQLARLKAQLRTAAGKIRKRESALAAAAEQKAVEPRTVEQVDSLEKLLNEALEALRTRRAELQKASESKGQKRNE